MALHRSRGVSSEPEVDSVDVHGVDEYEPTFTPAYGHSPKSSGASKGAFPRVILVVVIAALSLGLAGFCVSVASANIKNKRSEAIQQASQVAEQQAAEQAAKQKELEDALDKWETAATAAEKSELANRVIQLRPETTPEELEAALPKPGVEAEELSPQTGGRAVWITLEEGDTLAAIAKYFNVSVEEIMERNGLTNESELYAGDMIVIG